MNTISTSYKIRRTIDKKKSYTSKAVIVLNYKAETAYILKVKNIKC